MWARAIPVLFLSAVACRDLSVTDDGAGPAPPPRIGIIHITEEPQPSKKPTDPPQHHGIATATFLDTVAEPSCTGRHTLLRTTYYCSTERRLPRLHAGDITLSAPSPVSTLKLSPDAHGIYPLLDVYTLSQLAEGSMITITGSGSAVPPFSVTAPLPRGEVSVLTPEPGQFGEYRLNWNAPLAPQVRGIWMSSGPANETIDYCLLPGGRGQLNVPFLFQALAPATVTTVVAGDFTIIVIVSRTLTVVPSPPST